jgi:hypothetical protein
MHALTKRMKVTAQRRPSLSKGSGSRRRLGPPLVYALFISGSHQRPIQIVYLTINKFQVIAAEGQVDTAMSITTYFDQHRQSHAMKLNLVRVKDLDPGIPMVSNLALCSICVGLWMSDGRRPVMPVFIWSLPCMHSEQEIRCVSVSYIFCPDLGNADFRSDLSSLNPIVRCGACGCEV